MRHNVVLSFFGFWNLKIRPKIFQKSGTGFRRRSQEYTTPYFYGEKNFPSDSIRGGERYT